MDDDELRAQLASLLRPAVPIRVPDISVIRWRLRRRRATQATVSVLACACVVVSAGLIRAAGGGPGPSGGEAPPAAPACASSDLQAGWLSHIPVQGVQIDPLPETFLLGVRNIGARTCSVKGWPHLAMTQPARPQQVSVSYGTLSLVQGSSQARLVEPTRVTLWPGENAVSAVTVSLVPRLSGCTRTASWSVTLPVPGSQARKSPGGPSMICFGTSIVVSPVYPAGVPISANYPPAAPAAFPATYANSAPPASAGPAAAPQFVIIDKTVAPSTAVVRIWQTGWTQIVKPPAGSGPGGFTGVAGAGDDATFVLAAGTSHTRFYQLTLWDEIAANSLIPLPVPPIATPDTPFAVSADGSQLALGLPARGGTARIMVVSLVTGSTSTWTSPDPGQVTGLSWAGNTTLGFIWTASAPQGQRAASRSGLRLLDTARPGTGLLSSRPLIPASVSFGGFSGIHDPLFSQDGAVVFATMTSHAGGDARAVVAEFSGVTGRPLRLVTPAAGESGYGTWCGPLWTDPSGRGALAACQAQGTIRDGRFTPIDLHFPAPNFSAGTNFFAW